MDVKRTQIKNFKIEILQSLTALTLVAILAFVGIGYEIEIDFSQQGSAAEIGPHFKDEDSESIIFEAYVDDSPLNTQKDYYAFHKDIAINDFYELISKNFRPKENIKKRVSFWFDVYAKYGSEQHIIHHTKYPWIVFDVVDTSSINKNKKLHRWTRYHKAKRLVRARRNKVVRTLNSLAKRKHYRNLTMFELKLIKLMRKAPGKFRPRLKLASRSVRSQLGQRDFFREGLSRYELWINEIENTFKKYRLPVELTRLPFVESSFNPEAVSKVGASGIWQIMPAIGKKFLKVNKSIDERNDPIKAAKAAALLLKENKLLLKQWPLAVTAYNTGVGLMRKGVRRHKTKDLNRLIQRYKSGNFGFAAKNFYSSYLAALHVERYKKLFFSLEEKKQFWAENDKKDKKKRL